MARTKKVNVHYTGTGAGVVRRVVGDYVWEQSNGYVCAVAENDVQALLNNGDFAAEQAPDELPAQDKDKDGE